MSQIRWMSAHVSFYNYADDDLYPYSEQHWAKHSTITQGAVSSCAKERQISEVEGIIAMKAFK